MYSYLIQIIFEQIYLTHYTTSNRYYHSGFSEPVSSDNLRVTPHSLELLITRYSLVSYPEHPFYATR